MDKAVEFVRLVCSTPNVAPRELEVSHAEKLLGMSNNGGWTLPKDSAYQFSAKTGITKKAVKANA